MIRHKRSDSCLSHLRFIIVTVPFGLFSLLSVLITISLLKFLFLHYNLSPLINIQLKIHFLLLTKSHLIILTLWQALMLLVHYLLIYLLTNVYISALTNFLLILISLSIMAENLTSLTSASFSVLLLRTFILFLMKDYTIRLMGWLWDPHWAYPWLICLCGLWRNSSLMIVLRGLNLLFTVVMLMIHSVSLRMKKHVNLFLDHIYNCNNSIKFTVEKR